MTIEVTTEVFGQGKRHHVAFTLGNSETVEQLLPIPSRPQSRYRITGGLVSGASGSFFIAAGDSVMEIVSVSLANPTVVTVAAPHGKTGTFPVVIKGVAGSTPSVDGEFTATVTGATTFTIPVNVTVAATGDTGDAVDEVVSMSSIFGTGVGIAFLAVAGVTGQVIEPMALPPNKALMLASDSEITILIGYLLVEELFPN